MFTTSCFLMFFWVYSKLDKYSSKDWLTLHKWILVLLLAHSFLDDPFLLLNFLFQNKLFILLSELGKNLHLTILFYFWISVYDKIIFENIPHNIFADWSEKIKVFLLSTYFALSTGYRAYMSIKSYENEYEDLYEYASLLWIIHIAIRVLQCLYAVYFLLLMFYYIKLTKQGKIQAN